MNRAISKYHLKLHNRVGAVMLHTKRYGVGGITPLANDCGVAPSAVGRIVRGLASPSYAVANRIVEALEVQLGRTLSIREVFSESGRYPTQFVCVLCGCTGCLPGFMFTADNEHKTEYVGVHGGNWIGDVFDGKQNEWQAIEEIKEGNG